MNAEQYAATKSRIASLLNIEPTRDDPRADTNPSYSRAPWIGLTFGARWDGAVWHWGFGNYNGHYINLLTSHRGPTEWTRDDILKELERAAKKRCRGVE